ncbi:hypothetical protein GYMLUDRAFT_258319 [Collybiopsis luxurians FD-317 M1]|nr:hypothetical protein GYMLUDRAFT_258319 [Collybiopsis luxurians FD-317 M1]
MNLTFQDQKHPLNSNLINDNGVVLYNIHSPRKLFASRSTITKLDSQSHSRQVSEIELHGWRSDKVMCGAGEIPVTTSLMKRKVEFRASDNQQYEWKHDANGMMRLVSVHHPNSEVASFDPGSSGGLFSTKRPAILRISNHGLRVVDEIVATFVYSKKSREKSQQSALAGGVAATAAV